jgi:hypothetical protein
VVVTIYNSIIPADFIGPWKWVEIIIHQPTYSSVAVTRLMGEIGHDAGQLNKI